eukprot:scaffold6257_cov69-Skeletonema_menzelii.AAC.1
MTTGRSHLILELSGLGNCADSNGPESFVDNNLSYPSLDEFGQVDHDNDNYSSNSFHQKDDDYVLVNEVAENDAIDDDDRSNCLGRMHQ